MRRFQFDDALYLVDNDGQVYASCELLKRYGIGDSVDVDNWINEFGVWYRPDVNASLADLEMRGQEMLLH